MRARRVLFAAVRSCIATRPVPRSCHRARGCARSASPVRRGGERGGEERLVSGGGEKVWERICKRVERGC